MSEIEFKHDQRKIVFSDFKYWIPVSLNEVVTGIFYCIFQHQYYVLTKAISLRNIYFFLIILLGFSCNNTSEESSQFTLLSSDLTGITFNNAIEEGYQNFFAVFNYAYNGAGVSIGDINSDGLQDIFFTGNQVENKLYLNKGKFQFEDISEKAGIAHHEGWQNGTVMADVNGDGYIDIYVSRGGWKDSDTERANLLYINNGDLTFTESAAKYGLDDIGYSMQASFFDMDVDGDLDMYLINRPDEFFLNYQDVLKGKNTNRPLNQDKLYRNDSGSYVDVSKTAGITQNYGYGLGLLTSDINQDGHIDIYVANDYLESDYLYISQGDGTYVNKIKDFTRHVPFYAMGIDASDINNDGWEDLVELEMRPNDYIRSKTTMASMDSKLFNDLVDNGFHYQYMHNMLQLNRGRVGGGTDVFYSEIAQLTNLQSTDWSWSVLSNDFDHDGHKDVYITNGFRRDIFDKDANKKFNDYMSSQESKLKSDEENAEHIISLFSANKLKNFSFSNRGSLQFEDVSKKWGLDHESFSNGAAVADLDNDGDLDIVVNNIDAKAFVYRNNQDNSNNYLRIKLTGPKGNTQGFGTKINVYTNGTNYYSEIKNARGYLSSSEAIAHIGLGANSTIDSITVNWPDGKFYKTGITSTNQIIDIDYSNALDPSTNKATDIHILPQVRLDRPFVHRENKYDDYKDQVLLPHKYSELGPALSVADVNGDKLQDFHIGGASGQAGRIYVQKLDGSFSSTDLSNPDHDDVASIFFDVDGDGDEDLYVVSGGYEAPALSKYYRDRLYINDGKGNFEVDKRQKLPQSSGACVIPYDYDMDGDLDLFVGGRVVPKKYPYLPKSSLLRNDNGTLVDVTSTIAPELEYVGMVTDGIWTDIDNDSIVELIVVGEWMNISVFTNKANTFKRDESYPELKNTQGWWNTISSLDYDHDGDLDFVVGNLGQNYKYQASDSSAFYLFSDDYDLNGTHDVFLANYDNGQVVPVRGKECSTQQLPGLKDKFKTYASFAEADIFNILDIKPDKGLNLKASTFASIILINNNGQLEIEELPLETQFSSVNSVAIRDLNGDGKDDIIVSGNKYESEIETTRADASIGTVLLRGTDDNWNVLSSQKSNLFIPYDVKNSSLINIHNKAGTTLLVASNNDSLRLVTLNTLYSEQ